MSQIQKLYIITRNDLSAAQQAVQSSHALADAILRFTKEALEWHRVSNTLVILSVKDELNLVYTEDSLKEKNMKFVPFREPDLNDELTAIAIMPCEEAKEFTKNFSLALKNYAPIAQSGRAETSKVSDVGSNPTRCAKLDPEIQKIIYDNLWDLYE